jgi:hypothetical protein
MYLLFSRLREWFVQHENGHLTLTLVNGTFSDSLFSFYFLFGSLEPMGVVFALKKLYILPISHVSIPHTPR